MLYLILHYSPVVIRDNIQPPCHIDAFIFKFLNINATSGSKVFLKSVFRADIKSEIKTWKYGPSYILTVLTFFNVKLWLYYKLIFRFVLTIFIKIDFQQKYIHVNYHKNEYWINFLSRINIHQFISSKYQELRISGLQTWTF